MTRFRSEHRIATDGERLLRWHRAAQAPLEPEDVITGDDGPDVLSGTSGNDELNGLGGNDSLRGLAGEDTLRGGAGADTLVGGAGSDSLEGGTGNDTYMVGAGDVVLELSGEGTDTVFSSTSWVLGANFERLVLTGSANLDGTGNLLDNRLSGNAGANYFIGAGGDDTLLGNGGNDTLVGGVGVDSMAGGTGDDLYLVSVGDIVTENADAGIDTVQSQIDWALGPNFENLTLSLSGDTEAIGNLLDNQLTGNGGANYLLGAGGDDTLYGNGGNDTLAGGIDADHMEGGAGDDLYLVSVGDTLAEDADAGIDTVQSQISWTLDANFEHLILSGNNALAGTGNALDNRISGTAGNNTLTGAEGTDTLVGGAGDDVYFADNLDVLLENDDAGFDEVFTYVSMNISRNIERATLLGTAVAGIGGNSADNYLVGNDSATTLLGRGGNDELFGNGGNDLLRGEAGDDTIVGGTGADMMEGGDGNDTYYVDDPDDDTVEAADTPDDAIDAAATTLASRRTGDPLAVGTNIDTVISQVSYTLRANVENLELAGSENLSGTGNELNNLLFGNDGGNLLDGKDGVDQLEGGGGNDTLIGGPGNDILGGGAGDDTYRVGAGDQLLEDPNAGTDTVEATVNWTLGAQFEQLVLKGAANLNGTGSNRANTLSGNGANNVLSGKAGNDTLSGGAGVDSFVFDAALVGIGDRITDFLPGTDRIRLDDDVFTALAGATTLDADQFRKGAGVATAADAEDRILYNTTNGVLYYDADGTGAAFAPVRFAILTGAPAALSAGDFQIVS